MSGARPGGGISAEQSHRRIFRKAKPPTGFVKTKPPAAFWQTKATAELWQTKATDAILAEQGHRLRQRYQPPDACEPALFSSIAAQMRCGV
jgi:hypothetical protein